MKSFFVLNSNDDWNLEKPEFDKYKWQIDNIFLEELTKRGYEYFRGCYKYFNGKSFSKAWKYENGKWEHYDKELTPDCIFDKTSAYDENGDLDFSQLGAISSINSNYKVVNTLNFALLIDNKLYHSVLFKDYLPKTVTSIDEIPSIDSEKVVVKELQGSGSKFVNILNKEQVEKVTNNQIVQEFVDGKDKEGNLRDYRFVYINTKIMFGETREAPKGTLLTNCSKGAVNKIYLPNEMPENLTKFSNEISEKIKTFRNTTYSVDLMYDSNKGRPYLIELNSMPGLGLYENKLNIELDDKTKSIYSKYIGKLVDNVTSPI